MNEKMLAFEPSKEWILSLRGKVEKIREKCACGQIPQACRCNLDGPDDALGHDEHH